MDLIERSNNLLTCLSVIENEYANAIDALQPKFLELLTAIAQEIMAIDTSVEKIYWTQYIPYFNDGDECIFSIYDIVIRVDVEDDYELHEGDYNGPAKELVNLFYEILYTAEDFVRKEFGSHAIVSIERDEDGFSSSVYTRHD